jgi:hypothetical protein
MSGKPGDKGQSNSPPNGAMGEESRRRGWTRLYTRSYNLEAPAKFAFRWILDHAPFGANPSLSNQDRFDEVLQREPRPVVRSVYPSRRIQRVTEWEVLPPSRIVWHDSVYAHGRLQVQGEERYAFHGGDSGGCIVEVTVLRHPVSPSARVGFLLAPGLSGRRVQDEAVLFAEIGRAYRVGLR